MHAGELEAETEALLQMEAVSSADFAPQVLACLPQKLPWEISQQERAVRRDFTNIRYNDSTAAHRQMFTSGPRLSGGLNM